MSKRGSKSQSASALASPPPAPSNILPLFDHFLVVRLNEQADGAVVPFVKYKFSAPRAAQYTKEVISFCYPDSQYLRRSQDFTGEHFTFVLTEAGGNRAFGFCRRHLPASAVAKNEADYPECICLLSHHPFFSLFSQILEYVEVRWLLAPGAVFPLLQALLDHPLPLPGESFSISIEPRRSRDDAEAEDAQKFPENHLFLRNDDDQHQSTLSVPLTTLFRRLSCDDIITAITCLLCERRVVVCGSKLSTLSACIHELNSLLYPFEWQHIFIPLLPPSLLSYLCAPMPFLVGIHSSDLDEMLSLPLEEIIVIDLDNGSLGIVNGATEVVKLPSDVRDPLLEQLESQVKSTLRKGRPMDAEAVSDAWLRAFVELFGSWRKYIRSIRKSTAGSVERRFEFNYDAFIEDAGFFGPERAAFCKAIRHSQLFIAFCTQLVAELDENKQQQSSRFLRAAYAAAAGTSNKEIDGFFGSMLDKLEAKLDGNDNKYASSLGSNALMWSEETKNTVREFLSLTSNDTELIAATGGKTSKAASALSSLSSLAMGLFDAAPDSQKSNADAARSALRSLVSATFDARQFPALMQTFWQRLEDSDGRQWKHAFKALSVLSKLLMLGSDRVICNVRDNIEVMSRFVEYQHSDPEIRDKVALKAKEVFNLITQIAVLAVQRRPLYAKPVLIKKYLLDGLTIGDICGDDNASDVKTSKKSVALGHTSLLDFASSISSVGNAQSLDEARSFAFGLNTPHNKSNEAERDEFDEVVDDTDPFADPSSQVKSVKTAKSFTYDGDLSSDLKSRAPLAPPHIPLHAYLATVRVQERRMPSTFDVMQWRVHDRARKRAWRASPAGAAATRRANAIKHALATLPLLAARSARERVLTGTDEPAIEEQCEKEPGDDEEDDWYHEEHRPSAAVQSVRTKTQATFKISSFGQLNRLARPPIELFEDGTEFDDQSTPLPPRRSFKHQPSISAPVADIEFESSSVDWVDSLPPPSDDVNPFDAPASSSATTSTNEILDLATAAPPSNKRASALDGMYGAPRTQMAAHAYHAHAAVHGNQKQPDLLSDLIAPSANRSVAPPTSSALTLLGPTAPIQVARQYPAAVAGYHPAAGYPSAAYGQPAYTQPMYTQSAYAHQGGMNMNTLAAMAAPTARAREAAASATMGTAKPKAPSTDPFATLFKK